MSFPSGFVSEISIIVVIPVYDDPDIFETLDSLYACDSVANEAVGVIVVVNHSVAAAEEIKARNKAILAGLAEYKKGKSACPQIELLFPEAMDLPAKEAGVGLARKIGMDIAASYYSERAHENGVIVSLDADTLVEKNYFTEIVKVFRGSNVAGVSIAFEHLPEEEEACLADAIVKYELYLRYYSHALQYIYHPYAFYCVGSAFAVRAKDYVALGGMNKRQAGEDFYFIQKIISTGRFSSLSSTKVYPSSRLSNRTPFGTGQAVKQIMDEGGEWKTYNFQAFRDLKSFLDHLDKLYKAEEAVVDSYLQEQPAPLSAFLKEMDFKKALSEINRNVATLYHFRKRFFDHFNAFKVLKYLNYVHLHDYEKQPILEAATALIGEEGGRLPKDEKEALAVFKKKDFYQS